MFRGTKPTYISGPHLSPLMPAGCLVHRPVADRCSLGAGYTGLLLAPVPRDPHASSPCTLKLITQPCQDASIHWTALQEASRDSLPEMSNKLSCSPVPQPRNESQVLKMEDTRRNSSSARANTLRPGHRLFRSRRPCINLCTTSSLLLRIREMGPDRHETTLHCDSMEQKPDCQISLSAAISDNISTVKPGVCVSKIPVSAPRLSMRRHRPHPRHHGGLCPGGAAASTRLCGKPAKPLGASRHWHQTSTHCWEVSSHFHFHGTRAVLTPR